MMRMKGGGAMESKKTRVLVADDELAMRMFVVAILQQMNCVVVGQAVDGNEAIALYREHKPDLLLLDINMPIKTGDEALAEIRAEFPDARVIMLTSVLEAATVEKCIEQCALNYIRKDSAVSEIKAVISEALVGNGGRVDE